MAGAYSSLRGEREPSRDWRPGDLATLAAIAVAAGALAAVVAGYLHARNVARPPAAHLRTGGGSDGQVEARERERIAREFVSVAPGTASM